jgi:uncharacterized protein YjbJ (UPF0337 family)
MDENRVAGAARNIGGKAEQAFGRATGDTGIAAEGALNQVKGTAQNLYGQARDAGSSFEQSLRTTIEEKPYTAVLVALGIGWLLGRSHRPL